MDPRHRYALGPSLLQDLVAAVRALGLLVLCGAGAFAGFVGQPAVLSFAQGRKSDERIEAGYAAMFALCIVAKILAVQVMAAVL